MQPTRSRAKQQQHTGRTPKGSARSSYVDPHVHSIYPKSVNVSLQYAEEHLADLISAADRGEDVEITRPEMPTLKLISTPATPVSTGRRILGAGRGEMRVPTEEDCRTMDQELAAQMNESPLFPSV